MDFITILVIAVGLAMDSFAVSIASGAAYKHLQLRHTLRIALFFGGFQAFMPLIGALAGLSFREYIADSDHWLAFIILVAVGGKMIYESFKITEAEKSSSPSNIIVLLALSVATSIDALAIGITLSLVAVSIITAVTVIGLVTFVLSYFGVMIGKRFGHVFENKIEAFGGIVLIALGVKIVLRHIVFC
jgi:putative Mn2+ efflux pump MntP